MRLVVDASVALKWVLDEKDSTLAERLLQLEPQLLVPDFLLNEVANVIWVQVRERLFTPDEARRALARVTHSIDPVVTHGYHFHPTALDEAIATGHPVYDTLYVAVALAVDADVVIAADQPFHQAMQRHPDPAIARMVLPLEDWARARGLS